MRGLLAPCPVETHGRFALPSVRPFAPVKASGSSVTCTSPPASPRLLRPLLTSRSASSFDGRRPFRHEARSPQVRASAFPAPSPDLRRRALVARASRSFARSPCSTPPRIRFLFVDTRFRSPLLSAPPSPTVALRLAWGRCDQLPRRTCISKPCSCWAHKKRPRPEGRGRW